MGWSDQCALETFNGKGAQPTGRSASDLKAIGCVSRRRARHIKPDGAGSAWTPAAPPIDSFEKAFGRGDRRTFVTFGLAFSAMDRFLSGRLLDTDCNVYGTQRPTN